MYRTLLLSFLQDLSSPHSSVPLSRHDLLLQEIACSLGTDGIQPAVGFYYKWEACSSKHALQSSYYETVALSACWVHCLCHGGREGGRVGRGGRKKEKGKRAGGRKRKEREGGRRFSGTRTSCLSCLIPIDSFSHIPVTTRYTASCTTVESDVA